ncbi:MAG: efflux RND transporter periplasmic adaptor subunit [Acidobacteria bacterium]|nr:efflux RND transporter periplasmic adaptor subunit [Acidobacteriota bacterium]
MNSECPKLREGLVVSRQPSTGTTTFVIKDPARGRFFQLRELEYFIAQQLDGAASLDLVASRVQERFDTPLSRDNLEHFISRLRASGLLQSRDAAGTDASHQRRTFGGSLLYLRLKAFDPDRLFDVLAGNLRFLFSPVFLATSTALIILAAFTAAANGPSIARDFTRAFQIHTLFLAWLTVFLVIIIHEFSHGLTCKHFGGKVHDLGFLLIYFQPSFYCNVSDAWLFPERSKRLWVTLAGAYSELVIWATATMIWRVTEPGTGLSFMALVVMATSGIRSLFNLNPLIKLDGYYLLSDGVRIPNLRKKAFAYLGDRTRRLLGIGTAGTQETSSRERRIFLTYSLLAFTYSCWLLGIIAFYIGGALVRRYQGWGFVLFTGLIGAVLSNPIKTTLRGLRPATESVRKPRRPTKKLVIFFSLLALVPAALFLGSMDLRVSGEFTVLPVQNADIRAEVEGIVEQVFVEEGSKVNRGDPIALLSDRDYRAEMHMLEAEIAEKHARLRMLEAGPRAEEVQLAITSVEKAGERLAYSRAQLDRLRKLFAEQLLSEDKLEEGEEQVSIRQKDLEEAQGRLQVLEAGSRPEEAEAIGAEIARLTANRSYVQEELQSVNVVSPLSGIITTPKLKEIVGRQVKKGDLIAKVHALDTVTAEIAVPEREISDVKVGQKVFLRARALPGVNFTGTVASIAPTVVVPGEGQIERTVTVSTILDNSSFQLKSEMTGNAKILCSRQRLIDLLTRRFTRYVRVEFWSWW